MKRLGFGLAVCAMLAACGGKGDRPAGSSVSAALNWRQVATPADRDRLRNWRQAWIAALAKARASGNATAIADEGALFEPDHALVNALPPPGAYRCRVFKLGANGTATRDFVSYPWFECRVDAKGGVLNFHKTSGPQRPGGLAFSDGDVRGVFLGTMMIGDETTALDYGSDDDRDMAGLIERVGASRWRIVLPYPHFESILDVVEIVPAD